MSDPEDRLSELRIERDDEEGGSPWPRRLGLLALAVVLVATGWWWFLGRERSVEVALGSVAYDETGGAAVSVLDASGYVTARRQATVSSKVTGKIIDVRVEEGMSVKQGQVLARLDDSLARRDLELAEARLASARSALREVEVRRDEATKELRRQRELAQAGVASEQALDAAQATFDVLEARLVALRDDVVVVEREIALWSQRVEDHLVRAPFDGVAISKNAQPGEMISPMSAGGSFTRTGVSTIVDMKSLEIEVDVNEAYINRVQPDQRVVARLDAYPDWDIPARVITTIPAADRQKATVRVRIAFENLGDPRILPDMGVKVSFQAEDAEPQKASPEPLLFVPARAVRKENDRDVVFVASGETVERRAVTLGGESAGRRQVVAGLRAGESVVLDPPPELVDGATVRVKDR